MTGQPHMQIRTMSISDSSKMSQARKSYFGWYVPFSAAAVGVGLYSRVLLPDISKIHELMVSWDIAASRLPAQFDSELALPVLAMKLLPDIFIGIILAGLFAATMSTADSLILSSGAALTQDMAPRLNESRIITKLGTMVITVSALLFSLFAQESVFALVTITWSALGAGFGPLMIIRALNRPVGRWTAITMMFTGIGVVLLWRYGLKLTNSVYEILPGMLSGFAIYYCRMLIASMLGFQKDNK